jgi:predicted transcriptional regulator
MDEAGGWKHSLFKVEHFMTTDLFTVREDEPVDLVASLMDWKHIRHVPVEDDENRLVGIVSYRTLLHLMANGRLGHGGDPIPVSEVMKRNPIAVTPGTTTLEAIALMREHRISALPVVQDGRLVGIITERDFMNVTAQLLERELRG